jgi:hypothetical protein
MILLLTATLTSCWVSHPFSQKLTGDLEAQRCFGNDRFCAYFLSPEQFQNVATWVGSVRALTYRRISPHGPSDVDLDGRDAHYWHLLVWDQLRGALAGSLRMALSRWHPGGWDGNRSYLEHCYPGLDASLAQRGLPYAEIGRTFVAAPYQRSSLVLMVLLQGMASIPLATGHHHLLGMVSYNHFEHGEALNRSFLASLMIPPFRDPLEVPPPRHPLAPAEQPLDPLAAKHYGDLERGLEERYQEPFRVPVLMRCYAQFGNARVAGLSLARDFNQITEILMHCDLDLLNDRQRRRWVIEDLRTVWSSQVEAPPHS